MELVSIGKVTSVHGIKGELFVMPFGGGDLSWIHSIKKFTLETETSHREFTIQSIREHKRGLIVRTEEIVDRNESETYIGSLFQVPKELTVSKRGETIFLSEIEGFTVIDEKLGPVGVITAFSSNGAQDLLVVTNEDYEFQIPLIKDFLIQIEWENKKVKMKLPEGLVERE